MSREQEAIEFKLNRGVGQRSEKREEVAHLNAVFNDWTARCRVCGAELRGTLKELQDHRHGS